MTRAKRVATKTLASAAIIVGALGFSMGAASASCYNPFTCVACAINGNPGCNNPPPCTNIGCRNDKL